jgi:hypothetical protein
MRAYLRERPLAAASWNSLDLDDDAAARALFNKGAGDVAVRDQAAIVGCCAVIRC